MKGVVIAGSVKRRPLRLRRPSLLRRLTPRRLHCTRWIQHKPRRCVIEAHGFDSDDYFFSEDEFIHGPSPVVHPSNKDQSFKWKLPSINSENMNSAARTLFENSAAEMPKGWFNRALWLWERPVMKLGRLTVFFTQIPTALALIGPQIGALAGQITLPMLPPLLVGAGILLRSLWVNAGYLFPRLYLTTFILWGIWLLNSFICRVVGYFTRQGTITEPKAHTLMNWVEALTLVTAGLVILSLFGVNISALLLPAGICIALAAKDLSHNFLAGLVLFLAQPFRVGDEVSVQSTRQRLSKNKSGWFDGVCEKIDLRYTVLKKGKLKLFVPNASFITNEFLVVDQNYEEVGEIHTSSQVDTTTMDNICFRQNGDDYEFPQGALKLGHLEDLIRQDENSSNGVGTDI